MRASVVARKSLRYVDTGYRRARVEVRYYAEVPGPKIPAAGDCFLAPSKRNREVLAQNGYLAELGIIADEVCTDRSHILKLIHIARAEMMDIASRQ